MPLLDVSELMTDPDFATNTLSCARMAQAVGTDGRATDTPTNTAFVGVVTADKGSILKRMAEASFVEGSIMIYTKFRLQMVGAGFDADVVTWKGSTYTVTNVGDYSEFGQGFVWAICEPISLPG